MSNQRKKIFTIVLLSLGLLLFFLLRDTIFLFFLIPLVAIVALLIWTMPSPDLVLDEGGPRGDDPLLLKLRRLVIGVGLSILAAGVVTLLPTTLFWIVMGTVTGLIFIYFILQFFR